MRFPGRRIFIPELPGSSSIRNSRHAPQGGRKPFRFRQTIFTMRFSPQVNIRAAALRSAHMPSEHAESMQTPVWMLSRSVRIAAATPPTSIHFEIRRGFRTASAAAVNRSQSEVLIWSLSAFQWNGPSAVGPVAQLRETSVRVVPPGGNRFDFGGAADAHVGTGDFSGVFDG